MSFATLELCQGPACPRCGCRDARILQEPAAKSWWACGRARCRHCGLVYGFRDTSPSPAPGPAADPAPEPAAEPRTDPATPPPLTCGDCHERMKVSSTRKLFRWYKCPRCGKTQKVAR